MTQHKDKKLIDFPSEFHFKAVGVNNAEFKDAVLQVFSKHLQDDFKISDNPSKNNKFIAFNVTITATSRQQLDDIYSELHKIEGLQMLL